MPYEIGCVLVRDAEAHRDTFALAPAYLGREGDGRGLTGGDLPWFTDYGYPPLQPVPVAQSLDVAQRTRRSKYGRMIQQNIAQARYLAGLVEAAPD